MTKADVVLQKLAGLGSVMDKLPKSLRRGIMGVTAAGSLSVGAKAGDAGKWVDTAANSPRVVEMTGGNVMKGIPNFKAPHSGKQQIKLRLATGSEPDSLINTSSTHREVITANPRNTEVTRKITSFRN